MTTYLILFMFIGFIIWILKYLEKNLPKRDERIRREYKAKLKKEDWKKDNFKTNQNSRNNSNLNIKKKTQTNGKYIKADELANYFKIKKDELYKITHALNWSKKSSKKGWLATNLGNSKGAKHGKYMGTDYIHWNPNIKNNFELINAVNEFKNKNVHKDIKNTKITDKEKKEKGDKYELFIANFFREKGYVVWEHGKEKGREDKSIDLFVKKDKYIYFIQCKNWERWKIDHKEIKATRTDVRDYLKNNQEFWNLIKKNDLKILYVTSKECLTHGAYTYIQENKDIVEYQVIPMSE